MEKAEENTYENTEPDVVPTTNADDISSPSGPSDDDKAY